MPGTIATKAFLVVDQNHNLAKFISSLKGESEENQIFYNSVKDLLDAQKLDQAISLYIKEAAFLVDKVAEKDFESVFNLVIALCKTFPASLPSRCVALSKAVTASSVSHATFKLAAVTNMFNSLPSNAAERCSLFLDIVSYAAKAHLLGSVLEACTSRSLEQWSKQWGSDEKGQIADHIVLENKRSVFLALSKATAVDLQTDQNAHISYDFVLKYLSTFSTCSAVTADMKTVSLNAVVLALSTPTVLNFEDLFNAPVVQSTLRTEKSFDLLKIFLDGTLSDYRNFLNKNDGILKALKLDDFVDILEHKIKLLSICSLCTSANKSGRSDVTYEELSRCVDCPLDQVEAWVIDAIRSSLVSGRLSQPVPGAKSAGKFTIEKSSLRVFTSDTWHYLKGKVDAWQRELVEVRVVLEASKKKGQYSK